MEFKKRFLGEDGTIDPRTVVKMFTIPAGLMVANDLLNGGEPEAFNDANTSVIKENENKETSMYAKNIEEAAPGSFLQRHGQKIINAGLASGVGASALYARKLGNINAQAIDDNRGRIADNNMAGIQRDIKLRTDLNANDRYDNAQTDAINKSTEVINKHSDVLHKHGDVIQQVRDEANPVETFMRDRVQAPIDAVTAPGTTGGTFAEELAKGLGLSESSTWKLRILG